MNTPNPYNYNMPVGQDMLFGRSADVDFLVRQVTAIPGDSVALVAGRRMGKTSILEAITRELNHISAQTQSPLYLPVYLDFSGVGITSTTQFFQYIAEEMIWSINIRLSQELPVFSLNAGQPPAPAFGRWLSQCEQAAIRSTGRRLRLVLLLDECEQIVSQPWMGELYGALRFLLDGQRTRLLLKVILAGSHRFLDKVQERGSPLRNILQYHRLAGLDDQAVHSLCEQPSGFRVDGSVTSALYRQGGGHPFLSQYILFHLWEKGFTQVTVAELTAVANAFPEGRHDFWDWLNGLGQAGQDVYRAVAIDGVSTKSDLRQQLPLAPEVVERMLDALGYHGLIMRHGECYKPTAEMFRTWFQMNDVPQPVQSVDLASLRENLVTHFNEGELRDLCFDLGVDYDNLAGPGKGDKARELIAWHQRNGQLDVLIDWCKESRPQVIW